MYDFPSGISSQFEKSNQLDINSVFDLSTPEVSVDLQNFINNSNQIIAEELFFADVLTSSSGKQSSRNPAVIPTVPLVLSMPQSPGYGSDRYASEAGVKQEPVTGIETQVSATFAGHGYVFAGLPTISETALNSVSFGSESRDLDVRTEDKKSSRRTVDKGSDEYRRRRERNNIAVRKSREKAKQRCKDTEIRVCDLVTENDKLKKRVELLTKELSVLKNLLQNVGVSNESTVVKHGK